MIFESLFCISSHRLGDGCVPWIINLAFIFLFLLTILLFPLPLVYVVSFYWVSPSYLRYFIYQQICFLSQKETNTYIHTHTYIYIHMHTYTHYVYINSSILFFFNFHILSPFFSPSFLSYFLFFSFSPVPLFISFHLSFSLLFFFLFLFSSSLFFPSCFLFLLFYFICCCSFDFWVSPPLFLIFLYSASTLETWYQENWPMDQQVDRSTLPWSTNKRQLTTTKILAVGNGLNLKLTLVDRWSP